MRRALAPLIVVWFALPVLAGGGGVFPDTRAQLPRLTLDASSLGLTTQIEALPAVPREEAPEFFPPAHIRVTFPNGSDPRAALNIYPVAGLLRQYPEDSPFFVRARLQQLRSLLQRRPALGPVRELPYLPIANAAQVLHAAGTYLTFPGGSGIRYLTVFRQDFSPFLRRDVLYTFQGLTNDGRSYISFSMPVLLPLLPAQLEDVPASERHLGEGRLPAAEEQRRIQTYLRRVTQKLDLQSGHPLLDRLDALVRSLRLR